MGLGNWIRKQTAAIAIANSSISNRVLKGIPEDRLRVEMVSRDSSRGGKKSLSGKVKKSNTFFVPKEIKDWNDAVSLATDPERPSLLFLSELYENLMLDAHFMSVMESRILRVVRSKWDLVTESGDTNPDVKNLLEQPWFETFLYQTVMSKFTGIKVLELFDTDENGELMECTPMPMAHILPHRQEIAEEAGGEKGTSYVSGNLANYYIEIGNNGDLGILSQIATYILAKKQAMGAWLDHLHKFGVPPIIINTDNMTTGRQEELLEMGLAMHSNHVMVLQGNEEFTLGAVPQTDAFRVFKEFLDLLNSEISKRVLGQDGTTQNKENAGTYGSLKVMAEVADDRHESDKLFVKYIINKELLPRLPKISSFYTPLANLQFDWDESDELDQKEYVESAVKLATAGFELDVDELSQRSGITITGYNRPFSNNPTEEDDKGNSKKKSPTTPLK